MNTVIQALRQWLSQEAARRNAARGAAALLHQRRERDDVNTYLAQQAPRPAPVPVRSPEAWRRRAE